MTHTWRVLRVAVIIITTVCFQQLSIDSVDAVHETDSLALVDLYYSTNGDNWIDNTNWLSDYHVNYWYGISVRNKQVVSIIMSGNNMVGPLPASIGNLTYLENLHMDYNNIDGHIPTSIGNLTLLERIQMEWNQLSGPLPPEIGNCVHLEWILLAGNRLEGPIPPQIGYLENLTALRLFNNMVFGSIPAEIGSLSALYELDLGTNLLSGTIPPEIGALQELYSLRLANNALEGQIPPEIGDMTNLSEIWLSLNNLEGPLPAEIGQLSNLGTLLISHNELSGPIPPEIGDLTMLGSVDLSNNAFTGEIPETIGYLVNLYYLGLDSNQISGAVPNQIQDMESLSYVRINNNLLEDLPDLSSLPNLIDLHMQNNKFTFEDIEPHVYLQDYIIYAPQDSVGRAIDTTAALGSSFTFSVDVGGVYNIYAWYKDDEPIPGAFSDEYVIDTVDVDDSGSYVCRITNSRARALTLYSRPVTLNEDYITLYDIKPIPWELWPPFVLRPGQEVAFSGTLNVRLLSAEEGYVHIDIVNEHGDLFNREIIEGIERNVNQLWIPFDSLMVVLPDDPEHTDTLFVKLNLFAENNPTPIASEAAMFYRVFIHDWTFMVYMDGDNDLELASLFDFYEMATIGSNDSLAIVLQWDRHPSGDLERGYVSGFEDIDVNDWWQTRRMYVEEDGYFLTKDMGELNMGDPNTLSNFVKWGLETFPAYHYALVLWDHGGGWRARNLTSLTMSKLASGMNFPDLPPGGRDGRGPYKDVIVDETDNDVLYSSEIRMALNRLPKLDILAFDACFMSMVENAYQYRDAATYMVSSEAVEQWDGWPYEPILAALKTSPEMTPYEFSQVIVHEFGASYPLDWYFITQSSVHLSAMDEVKEALDTLAGLLISQRPWASVEKAVKETWHGYYAPHRDLYHFAELLKSYYGDEEVQAACDNLMEAISKAVVANYYCPLEENANGLAIFFPTVQAQYDASYDWVNNIELSDDTQWDEFLRLFVSRGSIFPDTYEPNDTLSQAYGPLLPQTDYYSYIPFSEDKDFYFVATGQQTDLSVRLTSPSGTNYDLAVYDANGTLLDNSLLEDTIDSLNLVNVSPGSYYMEVVSNGNFTDVPYILEVIYEGSGRGRMSLSFDDSDPDSSLFSANANDVIGSRMHAPDYPMMLDEVSFYIQDIDGSGTGGDGSFYVYLADYFGTILEPFPVTPGGSHVRKNSREIGWFSVDLSDQEIRLQSDFFLGIGYDGQNTPALGIDPEDNGATYQWDAATERWRSLTATAFVRATVSYLETPERVQVSIPADLQGPQGQFITVPIHIDSMWAPGADSLELDITFDPEILSYAGFLLDNTLTVGWQFDRLNSMIAGHVQAVLHGDNPVTGSGTLINVQFKISQSAAIGDTSEVSLDKVVLDGGTYSVIMESGYVTVVSSTNIEESITDHIPTEYALSQNYPNPFNPTTSIQFALLEQQYVRLSIHNTLGQEITVLVDGNQPAGFHEISWDASDFSTGVYFYRLKTTDFIQTKRMLLMR